MLTEGHLEKKHDGLDGWMDGVHHIILHDEDLLSFIWPFSLISGASVSLQVRGGLVIWLPFPILMG